jgi:hypothetical protein
MSLPSFDDPPVSVDLSILPSSGSGNRLPIWLLALCGSFTAVGMSQSGQQYWELVLMIATAVSVMSMTLQLKNYRKPALQRSVVRIMVMYVTFSCSMCVEDTDRQGTTIRNIIPHRHFLARSCILHRCHSRSV